MFVVIPSAGRPKFSQQVTLRNFINAGAEPPVLAVPQDQAGRYRAELPKNVEVVARPPNIRGISMARAWILQELGPQRDSRVLMLDDDLDFCYRENRDVPKLQIVRTRDRLEDMIRELDEWMDDGFVHVGLSARHVNSHMFFDESGVKRTPPYQTVSRMMNACAYDVRRLRKLPIKYARMELMEDFDLTLQLLRMGLPNRVSFRYCWNHRGSAAVGGCSAYRTPELQERMANRLKELHPEFVKVRTVKNAVNSNAWKGMKERVDVIVYWRKAFDEGSARS